MEGKATQEQSSFYASILWEKINALVSRVTIREE